MAEEGAPSSSGRITALSDGVFAFAMTLLVLSLQVPTPATVSAANLPHYIASLHNGFLVWVISFFVIGGFWSAHHRLFDLLTGQDNTLGWLNLLLLLSIAFLPFPTGLMGEYSDTRFAVIVYASSLFASATMITAMSLYVARSRQLVRADVKKDDLLPGISRGVTMQIVCLLSICISFFSLTAAIVSWILIPLIQRLTTALVRRFWLSEPR